MYDCLPPTCHQINVDIGEARFVEGSRDEKGTSSCLHMWPRGALKYYTSAPPPAMVFRDKQQQKTRAMVKRVPVNMEPLRGYSLGKSYGRELNTPGRRCRPGTYDAVIPPRASRQRHTTVPPQVPQLPNLSPPQKVTLPKTHRQLEEPGPTCSADYKRIKRRL